MVYYISYTVLLQVPYEHKSRGNTRGRQSNLVLYCTVLYCSVLFCTALYCTGMGGMYLCQDTGGQMCLLCLTQTMGMLSGSLIWSVLYCTVLYSTVLCCTALANLFGKGGGRESQITYLFVMSHYGAILK